MGPTAQALLRRPEGWVRTDLVPRSASNTRGATGATMSIAEGPAASLPTAGRHHRRASKSQLRHRTLAADAMGLILGDRGGPFRTPAFHALGEWPRATESTQLPHKHSPTCPGRGRAPHQSVRKAPGGIQGEVTQRCCLRTGQLTTPGEGRLTHSSHLRIRLLQPRHAGGTERPEPQASALAD